VDFLFGLVGLLLILAAVVLLLAQVWSRTPHGRLKPIFALTFGLTRLAGGGRTEGSIDAAGMTDPDSIARVRAEFLRSTAPLSRPERFDGRVEDRVLEGPGGPVSVRIYTPDGAGPFPLLVYLHGGGFVLGSPDYTDGVTRRIAREAPAVVVSVDYRMAPEHPFPAAVEDTDFVVDWCVAQAQSLSARPGPIAIGGDSAGGNLAAVAAQRDRRAGRERIALQVLIYPTLDAVRRDRPSQLAFGAGYGLTLKDMEGCYARYVPAGVDLATPDLSPLYASSVQDLPRALVFTAGFDLLRDEGLEYVERLRSAGVPVRHVHRAALPHGYITMTRLCHEAADDVDAVAEELAALAVGPDADGTRTT
jgi:acetyl esterase